MVNVKQIFKYIINNKKIMYLLSVSVLLVFCLILNITFSLFTTGANKEGAHIKIGEMSYIFDINAEYEELNSDIYNDRVIRIKGNSLNIYYVDITAENKYNTKYQLIYNYCSSYNESTNKCTYGNNVNGVSVYYSEDTTDSVNDIIASNGSKRIKVVVENNTNNTHYYELGMLAGYTHNELNINTNKGIAITESFAIPDPNDVFKLITYVDGVEVEEGIFPTTSGYVGSLKCKDSNGVLIDNVGTITWDGYKWGVSFTWIPLDAKCSAYFTNTSTIYGVKRDIDTSSSAWERIDASKDFVANAQIGSTAVRNDFDNVYPWSAIDTYSYNLTTGEEISLSEVGIDNFPFDGSHGEILTRIPEFYYRRYQQTESDGKTYEYIQISPDAIDGFTKSETFSVGRYPMSGNSTAVHSKSGVTTLRNLSITNSRTYARKLGDDFGQLDYRFFILQLLYLVEYADYNSQAILGKGYYSTAIMCGGCDYLGMKSGTQANDENHSIIYRGIEDIYGSQWTHIDGININSYSIYMCTDPSQYAVKVYTGCYKQIGYMVLKTNSVYPSILGYDSNHPLVAFPIVAGGSESTYITDQYLINSVETMVLVGGRTNSATQSGMFAWDLHTIPNATGATIGSRIIRYN